MTKMNSQRRSLSAALDMVEAAIDSLEKQAKQAKLFQEQQKHHHHHPQQQEIVPNQLAEEVLTPSVTLQPSASKLFPSDVHNSQESDQENIVSEQNHSIDDNLIDNPNLMECVQESSVSKVNKPTSKSEKAVLKVRSHPPGVLLRHHSSTPRKKSHKRSSSSSSKHHHKSSHSRKRERNNNVPVSDDASEDLLQPDHKHRQQTSNRAARYSQPTLSSKLREQLTEKPKKKEKDVMPFMPAGTQGKSYHVGVIIQKELGQLKSQPLGIWATSKQSSTRKDSSDSGSSILHRELSKN